MDRRSRRVDLPIAVGSLALGLGVWLFAQSVQARMETRELDILLRVTQLPDTMAVTRKPDRIKATVRGLPEELDRVSWQNVSPRAYVDLSSTSIEGSAVMDFAVELEIPPELGHFRWTHQDRVEVEVEEIVTRRFSVVIEPVGVSRTGLKYGAATVEPESVAVEGPLSSLNRISTGKVLLDLGAVQSGESVRLDVRLFDAQERQIPTNLPPESGRKLRVTPSQVSVTPILTASDPTRNLLVSPVWTGKPADGFRLVGVDVNPNWVSVQGPASVLSELLTLETESIALDGMRASAVKQVRLRFPRGTTSMGPRRVEVRLRIEPVADSESAGPSD